MNKMLLSALLLTAPPAMAQDAPAPAGKPVKERKICRAESETTSRMPVRTCLTKAEWDLLDSRRAENATTTLNRTSGGTRR